MVAPTRPIACGPHTVTKADCLSGMCLDAIPLKVQGGACVAPSSVHIASVMASNVTELRTALISGYDMLAQDGLHPGAPGRGGLSIF